MANVMSLKNLRNKVSRNGYDLSFKNAFTAKVGEILPVGVWMGLPGDKFRFNLNWFTRTQPVNTAAYARIREYYDFYVVPISQMWRDAPSFFVNMPDYISSTGLTEIPTSVRSQHPYFTSDSLFNYLYTTNKALGDGPNYSNNKNFFGYKRNLQTCKLLEYLGYGRFYESCNQDFVNGGLKEPNRLLNPFPLLAYQKIYNDYFRDSQWELAQPARYNVDYLSYARSLQIPISDLLDSSNNYSNYGRYNFLDLNYCNWHKDYFMGLLPRAQFGDEAVATPLQGSGYANFEDFNVNQLEEGEGRVNLFFNDPVQNIGLGAIALRRAEFMQRYKEITITGEQNYKDQVAKHWNVSVNDYLSGKCKYLGGTSSNVDIGEVVNSNLTGDSQADIAGKGTSAGRGNISYDVKEHCIVMCVYHCVPLLDYTSDIPNPLMFSTEFTDYPIPEMDKIGMEQVYVGDMLSWRRNYPSNSLGGMTDLEYRKLLETPLGWAPRYYTYKTTFDTVRGGFCDTLLSWVVPMSPKYLYEYFDKQIAEYKTAKLDYSFFKVSPNIIDPIFAVNSDENLNTDQFLINSFFDTKVVRNLDYDGLPY